MTPKEVVQELFSPDHIRRYNAGDDSTVDELVADDMVNHAAGPRRQGREGWKQILAMIANDLGPFEVENHTLISEGDMVAHHMTMRGRHQASTMPLLTGVPVTRKPVAWTYIHIWRVADYKVVEHWAFATMLDCSLRSARGRRSKGYQRFGRATRRAAKAGGALVDGGGPLSEVHVVGFHSPDANIQVLEVVSFPRRSPPDELTPQR